MDCGGNAACGAARRSAGYAGRVKHVVAALWLVVAFDARAAGVPVFTVDDVAPADGPVPTNVRPVARGGGLLYSDPASMNPLTLSVDDAGVSVAYATPACRLRGSYWTCAVPLDPGPLPAAARATLVVDGAAHDVVRTWDVAAGADEVAPVLAGAATASVTWQPARVDGTNCDRDLGAHFAVDLTVPAATDDSGVVGYAVREEDGAAAPWAIEVYDAFVGEAVVLEFDAQSIAEGSRCFVVEAIDVAANRSAPLGPVCAVFVRGAARVVDDRCNAPRDAGVIDAGTDDDDDGDATDDAGVMDDDDGEGADGAAACGCVAAATTEGHRAALAAGGLVAAVGSRRRRTRA